MTAPGSTLWVLKLITPSEWPIEKKRVRMLTTEASTKRTTLCSARAAAVFDGELVRDFYRHVRRSPGLHRLGEGRPNAVVAAGRIAVSNQKYSLTSPSCQSGHFLKELTVAVNDLDHQAASAPSRAWRRRGTDRRRGWPPRCGSAGPR